MTPKPKKFNVADVLSQIAPAATLIGQLAETFGGKSLTQLEALCAAANVMFKAKKIPLRISVWTED